MIITYNKFPDGDAGAIRQYTFGQVFKECGYNTFFIGMGKSTGLKTKIYNGFNYISLRLDSSGTLNKLRNYFGYKKRLKKALEEYTDEKGSIDVLLVIDIPIDALFFIKKYAKINKIQLIHDSVEWYSPEQFKLGKLAIPYILKNYMNKVWINKQFKVIAISKFLKNHFINRGINTIRIPVMLDIKNTAHNKQLKNEKLTIVYAGSPGKKDYLKEIIDGLALLTSEELSKIEFRIIGSTKEQIITDTGIERQVIDNMGESVKILGRVSRDTVLQNLEQANFTVLMRSPIQRYAKAGFPTKVVESLASGTPIILNLTSDLDNYITDMVNSIIIEACDAQGFSTAVKKALNLTHEQWIQMSIKARECADRYFDYRNYIKEIKEFLGEEV
ncbi:glycosyltransferase [Clostridium sp.]|uniref:glycosyltransferase n=1 Tax=Clostridium sp. TaxID=1506 RepID=UPI002FC5BCA7